VTEAQAAEMIVLLTSVEGKCEALLAFAQSIEYATTCGAVAIAYVFGLEIWNITHRALSCRRVI